MTTRGELRAWAISTRPYDWYGKCAGLTYQAIARNGGYAPDAYPSARAAMLATVIESTNPSTAPAGAVHYWDYYGTDYRGVSGNWGHVTLDLTGGGTDTLGATKYARDEWGVHAGVISVTAQTARGMTYRGWSRTYGARNRITITTDTTGTITGGGSHPIEEYDMTPDQAAKLDTIHKIVSDLATETLTGIPGVDLSVPAIRQAILASVDTHSRILVRDETGTPKWDAFQEIIPAIRVLLAAVGKTPASGAPVDVVALAAAIREGLDADIVDELAKRLAS